MPQGRPRVLLALPIGLKNILQLRHIGSRITLQAVLGDALKAWQVREQVREPHLSKRIRMTSLPLGHASKAKIKRVHTSRWVQMRFVNLLRTQPCFRLGCGERD